MHNEELLESGIASHRTNLLPPSELVPSYKMLYLHIMKCLNNTVERRQKTKPVLITQLKTYCIALNLMYHLTL